MMTFLSRLKNSKNLPGTTPLERVKAAVDILNSSPEVGFMEKSQITMAVGMIQNDLRDPEEALRKLRGIISFAAGLFDYDVVLLKTAKTLEGETAYPLFRNEQLIEVLEVSEDGVIARDLGDDPDEVYTINNQEFESNYLPAHVETCAEKQIQKLADYILENHASEIGCESAVECAIRLLSQ